MAGFQLPVNAIPPQLLAEMARAAFKPPALMSGGGGGGGGLGALPQSQGFNVGRGIAGMGQGLGMLAEQLGKDRGSVSDQPETSAVGPGGLSGAVSGIDALKPDANGVWQQPKMPTDIGSGQGGWWARNFGGWLADGGPVEPGKYYTVGERGPETFVPAAPGHIVPNGGGLGGMGGGMGGGGVRPVGLGGGGMGGGGMRMPDFFGGGVPPNMLQHTGGGPNGGAIPRYAMSDGPQGGGLGGGGLGGMQMPRFLGGGGLGGLGGGGVRPVGLGGGGMQMPRWGGGGGFGGGRGWGG